MRAVFSSGANRDIRNILAYYHREAGADIAADFHSELEGVVEKIKQWPESYPQFRTEFRRVILRRFPYQVIYRFESATLIKILVIRHHKRHPDFGLDR